MLTDQLPPAIVTADASRDTIRTKQVWRQIAAISAAWVATLVSLIALPQVRVFTLVVFLGLLFAVGLSWFCASRTEPEDAWTASGSRAPHTTLSR